MFRKASEMCKSHCHTSHSSFCTRQNLSTCHHHSSSSSRSSLTFPPLPFLPFVLESLYVVFAYTALMHLLTFSDEVQTKHNICSCSKMDSKRKLYSWSRLGTKRRLSDSSWKESSPPTWHIEPDILDMVLNVFMTYWDII